MALGIFGICVTAISLQQNIDLEETILESRVIVLKPLLGIHFGNAQEFPGGY
jgi:hypothetical protein